MLASRQQGWTKTLTFDGAEATLTIHSNAGGIVTGEFTLTADGRRWHQSLVLQCVSPAAVRDELTAAGLTLMTAAPNSTRWLLAKRR